MDKIKSFFGSVLTICIAICIILPSIHSFAHALEGHDHFNHCDKPLEIHLHENTDLDCDFEQISIDHSTDVTFLIEDITITENFILNSTPYTSKFYTSPSLLQLGRDPPIV